MTRHPFTAEHSSGDRSLTLYWDCATPGYFLTDGTKIVPVPDDLVPISDKHFPRYYRIYAQLFITPMQSRVKVTSVDTIDGEDWSDYTEHIGECGTVIDVQDEEFVTVRLDEGNREHSHVHSFNGFELEPITNPTTPKVLL